MVNLDDTEAAYCKVLLDEIFGRKNYITTIVFEASTSSSFKTINVGPAQVAQYLLFYAKDKSAFEYKPLYTPIYDVDLQHFSRFIENPDASAEQWTFRSINDFILSELGFDGKSANAKWAKAKKKLGDEEAKEMVYERAIEFALANCDRVFETKTLQKPSKWLRDHIKRSREVDHVIELERDGLGSIYLYKGRQVYFLGKGVKEVEGERVVTQPTDNIWDDIPTNNLKKEGEVDFPSGKKPEELIRRVISMISDQPSDIVLDSFGGSGTTGAVAHKMRRRWIMIEQGEHAFTHIVPRLQRVIDGRDSSGVTDAVRWKGGGGFRFYHLAPSLMKKDKWGNWIVNTAYNAEMLAEALCKHEGFTYAPSDEFFWMHGRSTETDFIYVTTQTLTADQLRFISDEVGPDRTLLICCSAWRGDAGTYPNLTLKKIPNAVLDRCEWDRDDYSLAISSLPAAPEAADVSKAKLAPLPLFNQPVQDATAETAR